MEPARVEISLVCEQTVSQNPTVPAFITATKVQGAQVQTQKLAGALEGSVAVQIEDQLRRWDALRGGAMLSVHENASSISSARGTENHLTQIAHPGNLHLGLEGV